MKSDRITFPGSSGESLAARTDRPDEGEPRAWALFAHCFTCSKDLKAVRHISEALTATGLGVLRFDFTGLGDSEGDFADTNFSSNVQDLFAAADFMRNALQAPCLIIGHSLGGTAVLRAAGRMDNVRAVATIGAPSDTTHIRDRLLEGAPDLHDGADGADEAQIQLAGRPFRIKRQMIDDLAEATVTGCIHTLGKPLIIFHSPTDETVDIDHARRIYQAAQHPKSFVSLDDADHLLVRNNADATRVGRILAAWSERYLS